MHRIAYMNATYPRATDTFVQREVNALRSLGLQIETASVRIPPASAITGPEQEQERRQTFYVLPCTAARLTRSHLYLLFTAPARYLSAICMALRVRGPGLRSLLYQMFYFMEAGIIAAWLGGRRIRHLHCHSTDASGTVAMLAAKMGGISYSMTLHGWGAFSEPTRWRLSDKLRTALFANCVSEWARSQAMIWAPSESWERLHVVHCGIDPDLYSCRPHVGAAERLLFVGRLADVKGLPILLRSFAIVGRKWPQLRLEIVGEGPERTRLERMARGLGIGDRVEFFGCGSQDQVRQRLALSDIFVMTSLAEGVPVSLMEAMATGVPVVAPRIAGIPELVTHGVDGFLASPGNEDDVAKLLEPLIANPELRAEIGRAARLKVEREFNLRCEAEWLFQVINARLNGGSAAVRRPFVVSDVVRSSHPLALS